LINPEVTLFPQFVQWECITDQGNLPYGPSDTYNLEKALVQGEEPQTVVVRNGVYEVDVKLMKQKNLRTQFLRDVKRTENPPLCPVAVSPHQSPHSASSAFSALKCTCVCLQD
jgi:hypothetical protein